MSTKSRIRARVLTALIGSALVMSLFIGSGGRTSAHTGDWIDSSWAAVPPMIDGVLNIGEWMDATIVDLGVIPGNQLPAFLLIKNDPMFLWIAYDAVGDLTSDMGDGASISFDTDHDLAMTLGGEDEFFWGPAAANGQEHHVSDGSGIVLEDSPFDNLLPDHAGLLGAFGFGPSDLGPAPHQMYELQIPLALLGVGPGQSIGFIGASNPAPGVMDAGMGFVYSTWPVYYGGPPWFDMYGDLRIGQPPLPADLDINPPSQSSFGAPASMVDHVLTVINLGTSPDTFDMGVMAGWMTELIDQDGITPLADTDGDMIPDTGVLLPMGSVDVFARVTIGAGGCDDALVGAASSNDVSVFDIAMLHTCVSGAALNPPHSDTGVDTDLPPDGLFDELRIDVGVTVLTDGFYEVDIELWDQTGMTYITMGSNLQYLTAGSTVVQVTLAGSDIYLSGIDGPYSAYIDLLDDMGVLLDSGTHLTSAYLYAEFEAPIASFDPPHSDVGVDTDVPPDGLFDELIIDVGVMVSVDGYYNIFADLYDQFGMNWIAFAGDYSYLTIGANIVPLTFNGLDIYRSGIDGPYMASLTLYDDSFNWLDSDSHLTTAYLHTDFDPPGALLNPPHGDAGEDTDIPPNGLFDRLRIDVGVDVGVDGDYVVEVSLWDQMQMTWITFDMNFMYLSAGPNFIPVYLSGLDIYNSGIDGPYYCDIWLRDDMGNLLDRGSHLTSSYLYTDFDGPDAVFSPPHVDMGIDTDIPPNGLYDQLLITAMVLTSAEGYYAVDIDLYDQTQTTWITYGYEYTYLLLGINTVDVYLGGVEIYNSGIDGPYYCDLELYDDFGSLQDQDSHLTASYLYTDFDPPGALFNPPHSDMGADLDIPPDGLFDELWIDAGVMVGAEGFYTVEVSLYDPTGMFFITWSSEYGYLVTGGNTVTVALDGMDIYLEGYDGAYIAVLELYDDFGSYLDFNIYTTSVYLHTDFDAPPALLDPPHHDYGMDSDPVPDGLFDYLMIDCNLTVNTPGTYQAFIYLYDSSWNYVTSGSSSNTLGVGSQTITVPIEGVQIFNSGLDGPYYADITLYDTGGYLDSGLHTTAAYSHLDFNPPGAMFEPPHGDWGLDLSTPPDGEYEFLVIDASVNVTRADTYEIYVDLYDGSGMFWLADGSEVVDLSPGLNSVSVMLSGIDIFESGYDGPYLVYLDLENDASFLDSDTHMTGPYQYTDFTGPGVAFSPPHSDRADDLDVPPDGLADILVIEVGIDVTREGTYLLTGLLADMDWLYLGTAYVNGYFAAGPSTIELQFDGSNIAELGIDGPYTVELDLYDEYGRFVDYDYYTTGIYTSTDFEDFDRTAPTSTVGPLMYWQNSMPIDVPFTASDPTPTDGLLAVVLHYSYSSDNSTWGPWLAYGAVGVSGATATGTINFAFPDGPGYYDLQTTAIDVSGNSEAFGIGEVQVAYLPPTELRFNPSSVIFSAGSQQTLTIEILSGTLPFVVPVDTTINLEVFSPTGEFRDVGGNTAITTATILAGQSSVDVDYYDETTGTWNLLAYGFGGIGGMGQAIVAASTAASISISPPAVSVSVAGSQLFTATVYDAFGNVVSGAVVTWTQTGNVGTIGASGVFNAGTTAGTGTVIAQYTSLQGTAYVTVTPGAASSLAITPASATVQKGTDVNLIVRVLDAYGNQLSAAGVAWTVDGPGTLSASTGATTTLTADGAGTITVTATMGALSATATFTAIEPSGAVDSSSLLLIIGALIAGIVIGFLVGWMISRKKGKQQAAPNESEELPLPAQEMPPDAPPQAPPGGHMPPPQNPPPQAPPAPPPRI